MGLRRFGLVLFSDTFLFILTVMVSVRAID